MKILAIHDGHTATACYLKDGKIISLVSEERFTNKKNQEGFPQNSVYWILKHNNLSMNDFDYIVFPHLVAPFSYNSYTVKSPRRKLFMVVNFLLPPSVVGSKKLINPYHCCPEYEI